MRRAVPVRRRRRRPASLRAATSCESGTADRTAAIDADQDGAVTRRAAAPHPPDDGGDAQGRPRQGQRMAPTRANGSGPGETLHSRRTPGMVGARWATRCPHAGRARPGARIDEIAANSWACCRTARPDQGTGLQQIMMLAHEFSDVIGCRPLLCPAACACGAHYDMTQCYKREQYRWRITEPLNATAASLLGFLHDGPMTGYDADSDGAAGHRRLLVVDPESGHIESGVDGRSGTRRRASGGPGTVDAMRSQVVDGGVLRLGCARRRAPRSDPPSAAAGHQLRAPHPAGPPGRLRPPAIGRAGMAERLHVYGPSGCGRGCRRAARLIAFRRSGPSPSASPTSGR